MRTDELTITLSREKLQWVLNAIAQQPYVTAKPVIDEILQQVNGQAEQIQAEIIPNG